MTCIVGMIDNKTKKVIIGGDSSSTSDSNIFIRKDPKVFKNNDFIFGCTTSYRMIQLLRFSFIPPEKIEAKGIYEYMCTDFINAVRNCYKDGGFLQKFDNGDERGGHFLVGYKDRLFKIEEDFQVAENLNGIDACGCGADFALGAISSLSKYKLSTKQKIITSLEAAEFLSPMVCRPFIIIST
jgi:ATP-dependent protease HslVU (ClpYQ) peptidase subunit